MSASRKKTDKAENSGLPTRLREIVGEEWGAISKFAKALGVRPQRVQSYIAGEAIPHADFLALLTTKLGINLNWLLTGQGMKSLTGQILSEDAKEFYHEAMLNEIRREIRRYGGGLSDGEVEELLGKTIEAAAGAAVGPPDPEKTSIKKDAGQVAFPLIRPIPVLGKVPAGKPGGQRWSDYDAPNFIETYLSSDDPDLIALKVSGESMFPTLYPNDCVLVSPNAAWDAGDMVVIEIDNYQEDYLVKRLGPTVGDRVMLFSDNWICYEPMEVEVNRTNVRGRVLGIYRTPSRRHDPQMFGDAGIVEYHRDPDVQKIMKLLPTLDEGHRQAIIEMIQSLNKAVGKDIS